MILRGPVGGQHVAQLRTLAAGVRQVAVPQDLLTDLDEGVGAALAGAAVVPTGVAPGERLQGGEERFAVLGGEQEAAPQRAVGVPA